MDTPTTALIPLYRDVDSQADNFELVYESLL